MGKSLEWLQSNPPIIIAPRSKPGQVITRYVPNNDSDEVFDRQNRLTGKTLRPTIMLDQPQVHYIWPINKECPYRELIEASRSLSCLGWGIDMAYADGQLLDDDHLGTLKGIRWMPKPGMLRDEGILRVPNGGSLADLRRAHESALGRIEHGKPLNSVHKPQEFDRIFYASAERPVGRPHAVFAMRKSDDEWYRYPHAKLIHIAGRARCAAILAMKDYRPEGVADADEWVESFVAGHRPSFHAPAGWAMASDIGGQAGGLAGASVRRMPAEARRFV